jgi:DNA-binding LacI/PurR family transcriptional regulator
MPDTGPKPSNAAAPISIGLVVRRSTRQLATEPFYVEFIAGMEEVLADHGLQVLMQVVETLEQELACYQRWAQLRAVRAVTLVDLIPADPRPALLDRLGLPAIVVGEPGPDIALAAVRSDGRAPIREAVHQLAALGHHRIARVTGLPALQHTQDRSRAFDEVVLALGAEGVQVEGDYSSASGADATRTLLDSDVPPTAIIFDNDVMAIAGLDVATAAGVDVPGALSIVAWDDSILCRMAATPLSAMSHDVHAVGILAAGSLLAVLDGHRPDDVWTPLPVFVPRASTGPVGSDSDPELSSAEMAAE